MIGRVVDDVRDPDADGVTLRAANDGDAAELVAAGTDPDIAASVDGLPRDEDEARGWIARADALFMVEDGPAVVGGVELRPSRHGTGELVVWVRPGARGQGVATAAVRAMTGWALPSRVNRLELVTDVTSIAAQRIALTAGFVREGVRRSGRTRPDGTQCDEIVWSRATGDPAGPRPRMLRDLPGYEPGGDTVTDRIGGELSDGVVLLRPLGPADTDDMYELLTLPDVASRQVPPGPSARRQVARRCAHTAADWLAGNRAGMAIVDAATGTFAGEISLSPDGLSGEGWIGYSLLPAWRGRGLTSRAVRLLVGWALELGFPRLCAGTMADNVASQRVLRAAGFTFEGVRRAELPGPEGTRNDDHVFVLLPEDVDEA